MKQIAICTVIVLLAVAMPVWGGVELSVEARDLESYLGLRIPSRIRLWVEGKSDWVRRDVYSDERVVRMNVMTEFAAEMLTAENTDALVFLVLYRTTQGMDRELARTPAAAEAKPETGKSSTGKPSPAKKPAAKKLSPGTNVVAVAPLSAEKELRERRDRFAATANELAGKLFPMEALLLQNLQ